MRVKVHLEDTDTSEEFLVNALDSHRETLSTPVVAVEVAHFMFVFSLSLTSLTVAALTLPKALSLGSSCGEIAPCAQSMALWHVFHH